MSQPQNFNPNHVVGAKSSQSQFKQSQFKQTNQKTKLRNFEEQGVLSLVDGL